MYLMLVYYTGCKVFIPCGKVGQIVPCLPTDCFDLYLAALMLPYNKGCYPACPLKSLQEIELERRFQFYDIGQTSFANWRKVSEFCDALAIAQELYTGQASWLEVAHMWASLCVWTGFLYKPSQIADFDWYRDPSCDSEYEAWAEGYLYENGIDLPVSVLDTRALFSYVSADFYFWRSPGTGYCIGWYSPDFSMDDLDYYGKGFRIYI